MRALVVTNMYPTPERPASGPFVRDQVEALRRRGDVDVELFHFPAGTRNYARAARELRRRYGRDRFDVVHAHFGLVAWPALLAGLRPLVVTLHGNDLLHPRSKPFTRAVLPLMDLPAAVSRAFSANVPGAGRTRRVAILPCGVDLTRFGPIPRAEARERLGLDPAGPVPAVPARDLAAAASASTAPGRWPATSPLLTLGGVPAEEVPYWINAANAVIVPSQDEGMGLAVIEASACDVPAFGTPVGAHPVALAGIEGSACLEWDAERWREARRAAPGGRGSARRRPPRRRALLGRPDGRAGRGGVARAARRARLGATYTRSDGTFRAFRTFMSGLLRRIRRTGAAEETRTEPLALPDPAHGSAPAAPAPGEDGQRLPAGAAPADVERRETTGRRSQLRRRVRFLRRARELALRDLGGLVYEALRRDQDGGKLVAEKVEKLTTVDAELHGLEEALGAPRGTTVIREPGVGGTCPRCGELHASDAHFCAHCGLDLAKGIEEPAKEPEADGAGNGKVETAETEAAPETKP